MEAITSSPRLTQLYDGLERDAFVIRQNSAPIIQALIHPRRRQTWSPSVERQCKRLSASPWLPASSYTLRLLLLRRPRPSDGDPDKYALLSPVTILRTRTLQLIPRSPVSFPGDFSCLASCSVSRRSWGDTEYRLFQ